MLAGINRYSRFWASPYKSYELTDKKKIPKNNKSNLTSITRKTQLSETIYPSLRNKDQRPAQLERILQNHIPYGKWLPLASETQMNLV